MGNYLPDTFNKLLIDELCNAREIDWERAAKGYFLRDKHVHIKREELADMMRGFLKGGNIPEIPLKYMLAPADWREKPLSFIREQIRNSPKEYKDYLKTAVTRYKTACEKRLGSKPDCYRKGSVTNFGCYHPFVFLNDESYTENSDIPRVKSVTCLSIMDKMPVLNKLQELLDEWTSSTDGGPEEEIQNIRTDKRKKLSDELFEKEVLPKIIKALLETEYSNKKDVFKAIVANYDFGWSLIEKKYNMYRDDPEKKLIPALEKYGNADLIIKSNNGKKLL